MAPGGPGAIYARTVRSGLDHFLTAVFWGAYFAVLGLGDCQAEAAHRALGGNVNFHNVIEVGIRRRSRGDKANAPNCQSKDERRKNESDEDHHERDSMIVPFAIPPPSHIA